MGETMSEQGHLSDLGYEGQFGLERRGYNRMQVDEAVAQLRLDLLAQEDRRRELEHRLSQTVEECRAAEGGGRRGAHH